jgi:hypothetical protein
MCGGGVGDFLAEVVAVAVLVMVVVMNLPLGLVEEWL